MSSEPAGVWATAEAFLNDCLRHGRASCYRTDHDFSWTAIGAGGSPDDCAPSRRERSIRFWGLLSLGLGLALMGAAMIIQRGRFDENTHLSPGPKVDSDGESQEVIGNASGDAAPSDTSTIRASTPGLSTWRVVFHGPVNVQKMPESGAPIVQVAWKCDLLRGRRMQYWLEVVNSVGDIAGYSQIGFNDFPFLVEDTSEQGALCAPCSDNATCKSIQWQVRYPGHVVVYSEPNHSAEALGLMWKCDLAHGYPIRGGWLKITGGKDWKTAYVQIFHNNNLTHRSRDPTRAASEADEAALAEVTAADAREMACDACVEGEGVSCQAARCCKNPGQACYQSTDGKASCRYACTPSGEDRCLQLGARSWAPQLPGFPTLYCWQLARPDGYEPGLVKEQVKRGAGIFACDDFDVFSIHGDVPLGRTPAGRDVRTVHCVPHDVGRSKDNTAGNTEIFLNAWDAVKARDSWGSYGWTIKMDPDAVLVPNRLRVHIMSAGADGMKKGVFFRTCNVHPKNPDYPMMLGALEAISRKALDTFFRDGDQCQHWLPMADYGEDLFITKCLQRLDVSALDDYSLVGDDRCDRSLACWDHTFAAFHAFKNVVDWVKCWEDTFNGSF